MFANRFTVVTDACVLVPPLVRNLLLSLAEAELFRLRWSPRILDEFERGVAADVYRRGRSNPEEAARGARSGMEAAFPEAVVDGFEPLENTFANLPDPADAHVIAAAIKCGAALIVTDNLRDFPAETLRAHGIEARSADDFIADTIDLPTDSSSAIAAIGRMRRRLQNPELSQEVLLIRMERSGLNATAAMLSEFTDLW